MADSAVPSGICRSSVAVDGAVPDVSGRPPNTPSRNSAYDSRSSSAAKTSLATVVVVLCAVLGLTAVAEHRLGREGASESCADTVGWTSSDRTPCDQYTSARNQPYCSRDTGSDGQTAAQACPVSCGTCAPQTHARPDMDQAGSQGVREQPTVAAPAVAAPAVAAPAMAVPAAYSHDPAVNPMCFLAPNDIFCGIFWILFCGAGCCVCFAILASESGSESSNSKSSDEEEGTTNPITAKSTSAGTPSTRRQPSVPSAANPIAATKFSKADMIAANQALENGVVEWLTPFNLEQYAITFIEEGYTHVHDLEDAAEEDLKIITAGMKKPEAKSFFTHLQQGIQAKKPKKITLPPSGTWFYGFHSTEGFGSKVSREGSIDFQFYEDLTVKGQVNTKSCGSSLAGEYYAATAGVYPLNGTYNPEDFSIAFECEALPLSLTVEFTVDIRGTMLRPRQPKTQVNGKWHLLKNTIAAEQSGADLRIHYVNV